MQSRRFIAVIMLILLVLAVVLVFTDPWSTLRKDGKQIAISDPSAIDRIILSDLYDSVLLIKQGEEWLLFGEERINPVAVENLLFAAERLQINSIVVDNEGAPGTMEKSIAYLKGDKVLLAYTFQVRGDQYLISPSGSDRNFLVSVAGYPDLNLDRVFSSSANHFREHVLIDLLPSEISLIEIELADEQGFRFTQSENGDIACAPSNEKTELPSSSLDDLSTRLLFSYFTSIRYEQRAGITVHDLADATGDFGRRAKLHVVSDKGQEYTLQVYPYQAFPGDKAHSFKALVLYNDEPEALVVNYIYLDVLMRGLSHYFVR